MCRILAILFVALPLAACNSLQSPSSHAPAYTGESNCPRPQWDNVIPLTARDDVMASVYQWLAAQSSAPQGTNVIVSDTRAADLAYAPCGGGLSCDAVASYVRALGATVTRRDTCGVHWNPESADKGGASDAQ